jgi:hypothetical protein
MNKYIVALHCGGLMEAPEIYHTSGQIIEANTEKEAVEIYNKKNNCYYFYGDTVAQYKDGKWEITDHKITKYQLESLIKQNEKIEVYE